MMAVGACGLMNAVGNLCPGVLREMCEAVWKSDLSAARLLHQTAVGDQPGSLFRYQSDSDQVHDEAAGMLPVKRTPAADGAGHAGTRKAARCVFCAAPVCSNPTRSMKIATFAVRSVKLATNVANNAGANFQSGARVSYGIVTDRGVVDAGARCAERISRFACGHLRRSNRPTGKCCRDSARRFCLTEFGWLKPIPNPGKDSVRRRQLSRSEWPSTRTIRSGPKYPSIFVRLPASLVADGEADRAAAGIEATGLRR